MADAYLQVIAHYHASPGNGHRVVELLAVTSYMVREEDKP
ncbi:hypothetical protein B0G77_4977 [Paraburkholderia sp. BL10I2N1]|nr:hypothetical protein B0G77_4977 [Paraburkholderia sp. BL10I2N1]